jgi:hypothetical protein
MSTNRGLEEWVSSIFPVDWITWFLDIVTQLRRGLSSYMLRGQMMIFRSGLWWWRLVARKRIMLETESYGYLAFHSVNKLHALCLLDSTIWTWAVPTDSLAVSHVTSHLHNVSHAFPYLPLCSMVTTQTLKMFATGGKDAVRGDVTSWNQWLSFIYM